MEEPPEDFGGATERDVADDFVMTCGKREAKEVGLDNRNVSIVPESVAQQLAEL
jgi:hypothetical protein